jgi:hypothetical protein
MKSQKAKTNEHPRHGYIRRANNYTCLFARHVPRQTKHSKTLIDREGTPVYQMSCTGNVIKGNSEAVCLDQISCHLALVLPILFDVELRFRSVGGNEYGVLVDCNPKVLTLLTSQRDQPINRAAFIVRDDISPVGSAATAKKKRATFGRPVTPPLCAIGHTLTPWALGFRQEP